VIASLKLWIANEAVLLHKTGQTQAELVHVWSIVRHGLIAHYKQQHTKGKPPLLPFESLLVTLYWMRVYPSTACMAAEFDIPRTRLLEVLSHTLDALFITLVPAELDHSTPLPRAFTSGVLTDVCAVVDATFWVLPRTADKADRKLNYHYKSGTRQALKWQLCVTPKGTPWHISDVVHGSKADKRLLEESELMEWPAIGTLVLGDKGYVGAKRVMTPKKKPRGRELKDEDKEVNKKRNSARVVVENCIHQFKRWAILGGEYRGKWRDDRGLEKAKKIVHVIGAMVKRYVIAHPLRD
jgi:hypothetical protein